MKHQEMLELEKLALKYDENAIPLYLSYPTESFWNQPVNFSSYEESLAKLDYSFLYIHFPFCNKICHYCMCHKKLLTNDSDLDNYIQHLVKEIQIKLLMTGTEEKPPVKHMHWGGGTPTLLNLSQIEKVHNEITRKFELLDNGQNEYSLEAYPDEKVVTKEKLQLLKELGFNAISYGIQDFDLRIQKTINREHDANAVQVLIEKTKLAGLKVHIDLCYGLPFQGLNELERTLQQVMRANPDRITLFPYTHLPFFFPRQKIIPRSAIPNSFAKVMLIAMADDFLSELGFKKIGLGHYIKKGDPFYDDLQEHGYKTMMGYSPKEKTNFLGFGTAAISFFDNTFYQNSTGLKEYCRLLEQSVLPFQKNKSYRQNQDDLIRNTLIQKYIMTRFRIDKKTFSKLFDINFDAYFPKEMKQLCQFEDDGLVDLSETGVIHITDRGRFFSRHIAYLFDSFYKK